MSKGFSHESAKNKTVEWYTPKYIFDALGVFFDLDPCSPGKDIVPWVPAKKHYTIEQDGRMLPWVGNVWMNPPYNKETPLWMERLASHGTGIALLFSRTDTKWFHRYVAIADAICLVKGRTRFVPENKAIEYARGGAVQLFQPGAASILVAYGENNTKALFESNLGLTLRIE